MHRYLGKDTFLWWHGVVEDINDPLYLGRCRVRVFGYHTKDKTELPTAALPWAYPMQPVTSAAISGIGQSPTGLLQGSHVFGFFRDGEDAQDPVIIGSFGGVPIVVPDSADGFVDPQKKYPARQEDIDGGKVAYGASSINEQDTNRLARNDVPAKMDKTVVKKKKDTAKKSVKSVPDMKASSEWKEPETPYNALYPKNHVRFTESGHIQEFDDTPGAERVHEYHSSGTFTEIGNGWKENPSGTRVQRVVGDDYEIVHGNKKVYITGKSGLDLVVDGSVNITINSSANIQVNGDTNLLSKGNAQLQIGGSLKASAKTIELYAKEDIGISGKTVSLMTDGSVVVLRQGRRVEVNSGSPALKPKPVDLKGG